MSSNGDFQFIRPLDTEALHAAGANERVTQRLLEHANGAAQMTVQYTRTPAGGGSPEGLHTHEVDQVFYVLSGTMFIEINGEVTTVGPDTVIVFPAGVPHRNWNDEETVHLAMTAPVPDPSRPFAIRVNA